MANGDDECDHVLSLKNWVIDVFLHMWVENS